jgi:hypothetical protein
MVSNMLKKPAAYSGSNRKAYHLDNPSLPIPIGIVATGVATAGQVAPRSPCLKHNHFLLPAWLIFHDIPAYGSFQGSNRMVMLRLPAGS